MIFVLCSPFIDSTLLCSSKLTISMQKIKLSCLTLTFAGNKRETVARIR